MQKMKNYFKEIFKEIKKLLDDKHTKPALFLAFFALSVKSQIMWGHKEDLPTFIITLIAFLAAAFAIWQQHKDGIRQEERHKDALEKQDELLKEQKEAGIKQEIIGAWQVLANKAAGNSGKIEAIQFLAKQKKSLQGINMSTTHHGGRVYLSGLDVSKTTLGHKAYLWGANFEGTYLSSANFEGATLSRTDFEGADLCYAHFEGADLHSAHFEGAYLWWADFENASFFNNNLTRADFRAANNMDRFAQFNNNFVYCDADKPKMAALPITDESDSFKFEFDEAKPSEPELDKDKNPTGRTRHFIKLVFKTTPNPN